MSEHAHGSGNSGRPPDATTAGPVEVDCSQWDADVPPGRWSAGRLVRVCHSLPPVTGAFGPAAKDHLEISLRLAPDAAPASAFLFATRMLGAACDAAPDLRLRYDPEHSRAEPGQVVIARVA